MLPTIRENNAWVLIIKKAHLYLQTKMHLFLQHITANLTFAQMQFREYMIIPTRTSQHFGVLKHGRNVNPIK